MSNRRILKQIQRGLVQRRATNFYQGISFGLIGSTSENLSAEEIKEDSAYRTEGDAVELKEERPGS